MQTTLKIDIAVKYICEAGVSPFTIICPCNSKEN